MTPSAHVLPFVAGQLSKEKQIRVDRETSSELRRKEAPCHGSVVQQLRFQSSSMARSTSGGRRSRAAWALRRGAVSRVFVGICALALATGSCLRWNLRPTGLDL